MGFISVVRILAGFLACAVTSLAPGITLLRGLGLGYVAGSALTGTLTLAISLRRIAWEGVFLAIAGGLHILLWRPRPWWSALKPTPLSTIPLPPWSTSAF